jgi:4-diphosphocytidyl-2-C-methyl-D-erythritol kinase
MRMSLTVRSFAKINLGLCIGPRRTDGYHELATLYQTVAWDDRVTIHVENGRGIEVRCQNARVPQDSSNTCYRIAERVLSTLAMDRRVTITIDKELPVQGGLGAASSNAVATLLGLERQLGCELSRQQKVDIAAQVGSDLPFFLFGGTALGVGRGEDVHPGPDLPPIPCVLATPGVGISTPQAFQEWDRLFGNGAGPAKLTRPEPSDKMNRFSSAAFLWLNGFMPRAAGRTSSGVPVQEGGGRVETLLLDLVRAGIANDFERVVFPQHPELAEVKRQLADAGARYASLSGSGSTVYGLFDSPQQASRAAGKLEAAGIPAKATSTLPREQYWRSMFE